jgi:hypothetical protein
MQPHHWRIGKPEVGEDIAGALPARHYTSNR